MYEKKVLLNNQVIHDYCQDYDFSEKLFIEYENYKNMIESFPILAPLNVIKNGLFYLPIG